MGEDRQAELTIIEPDSGNTQTQVTSTTSSKLTIMATPEQLAAIHYAMMEELGIGRKETLYLDNRDRLDQPADLVALERGKRSKDPYSKEFKITSKHAKENKAWKEACKGEITAAHLEDQLDNGQAHRQYLSKMLAQTPSEDTSTARGGKDRSFGEGRDQTNPKKVHEKSPSHQNLSRHDDETKVKAAVDHLRGKENLVKKDAPHTHAQRKDHGSVSFSNNSKGHQTILPKTNLSYYDSRSVSDLPISKNIARQVRQPKIFVSLATPAEFLAAQNKGGSKPIRSPQEPGTFQSAIEVTSAGLGISRSATMNLPGSLPLSHATALTSSPVPRVGLVSSVFANNNPPGKLSQSPWIAKTVSPILEATERKIDAHTTIETKPTLVLNHSLGSSQCKLEEAREAEAVAESLFEATCKVGTKVHRNDPISSIGICTVHLLRMVDRENISIALKIVAGNRMVYEQTLEHSFKYHIDSAFLAFESLGDQGLVTKWQMGFKFAHFANRLGQMIEDHRAEFTKPTSQLDLPILVSESHVCVSTSYEGEINLPTSLYSKDVKNLISFSDSGDDVDASENLLSSYAEDLMSLLDDQAIDRALETLNRDESLLDQISTTVNSSSAARSVSEFARTAGRHHAPETSRTSKHGDAAISIDLNGGLAASQYAATNEIVRNLLRKSSTFRSLPEEITSPYTHKMSQKVLERAQNATMFSSQSSERFPLVNSPPINLIGAKPSESAFISYTVEDLLSLRNQALFLKKKLARDEQTSAGGSKGGLMPNVATAKYPKATSQNDKLMSNFQPPVADSWAKITGPRANITAVGDLKAARPQKPKIGSSWQDELDSTEVRASGMLATETQNSVPQVFKSIADSALDMSAIFQDQVTERVVSQQLVDTERANLLGPQRWAVPSVQLLACNPTTTLSSSDKFTSKTSEGSVNLPKPPAIKNGPSSSRFASSKCLDEITDADQEEEIADRLGSVLLQADANIGTMATISNSIDSHAAEFSQREQVSQLGRQHWTHDKHITEAGNSSAGNGIESASMVAAATSVAVDKGSISFKEKADEMLPVTSPLVPEDVQSRIPGSWRNPIYPRRDSFGSRCSKDSTETVRPLVILSPQLPLKEEKLSTAIGRPSKPSSRRMLRVSMDSTSSTSRSFETVSEGNSSEEDDKRMIMPLGASLLPGSDKSRSFMDSFANVPKSLPRATIDAIGILADHEVRATQPVFGQPWNPPNAPIKVTASAQAPNLKGGLMSSRFASAQNEAVYQATKPIDRSCRDIISSQHGIETAKTAVPPNVLANEFFPGSRARSQEPSAGNASLPKYGTVMVPDPSRPGKFLPIHGIVAHPSAEVLATRDATLTRMHQGLNLAAIALADRWTGQPKEGFLVASGSPLQSGFQAVKIPMTQSPTSQISVPPFSTALGMPGSSATHGSQHLPASPAMHTPQSPSGRENIMPSRFTYRRELSSPTNSKTLSANRTDTEDEVRREVRGRLEKSLAEKAATSGRIRVFE